MCGYLYRVFKVTGIEGDLEQTNRATLVLLGFTVRRTEMLSICNVLHTVFNVQNNICTNIIQYGVAFSSNNYIFFSGNGLKKAEHIDLLTYYIVSSTISKIKQYVFLPPVMTIQHLCSIFEIAFDFEQYSSL